VPNLIADRAAFVAPGALRLNVRRLMYQPLIWLAVLRDDAGGMLPPRNAEHVQCLADTLIHGVRRDSELDRNLLGGEMLVDEAQAIELPLTQPCHAFRNVWLDFRWEFPGRKIRHSSFLSSSFLPRVPPRVSGYLSQIGGIVQE
jgi:hypothetical protein